MQLLRYGQYICLNGITPRFGIAVGSLTTQLFQLGFDNENGEKFI